MIPSPSQATPSVRTLTRLAVAGVLAMATGFVTVVTLDAVAGAERPPAEDPGPVVVDAKPKQPPTASPRPPVRAECAVPDGPMPSPGDDLAAWLDALPAPDEVGTAGASEPDETYGMRASEPVSGMTIRGGRSAALLTQEGVVVGCSRLAGANDGLKPADGTVLRDSVVSVSYGAGAHADHVQVTDKDRVELRRVRLVAENDRGATDEGWNAAFFVHGDSTDWVLEDVHVQAGAPELAIRSYYPIRLTTGTGIVRRLVVDREVMLTDDAVQVGDDADVLVWEDVFVREPDGSLTPVARP